MGISGLENGEAHIGSNMRWILAAKGSHDILAIATLREEGSQIDLPNDARLLALGSALCFSQTLCGSAARHAAVGVHDDDHIMFFVVEDGNEHAVSDVLAVVVNGDVSRGSDRGEERREDRIPRELEEMAQVAVLGGVLRGARDDDEERAFVCHGDLVIALVRERRGVVRGRCAGA